ncbi:MAG: DUF3280 domain-containing protein, partial [Gemmatimonadota bacterium]|nr:DUF3280 domain-containing protein [Gemmatimonadota bacterium]
TAAAPESLVIISAMTIASSRILAAVTLALVGASEGSAQATVPSGPESPSAAVAVLTAALYNEQANVREATDSARAALATSILRERLSAHLGNQVVPYHVVDSLALSPAAHDLAGGVPCNVKVNCAREVARQANARWAVLAKVSKTSNLIWLLTAQLVRVSTGEIILDDSTELKGDPETMVPVGARNFADRVARTVRRGGYATNYPDGEPDSGP